MTKPKQPKVRSPYVVPMLARAAAAGKHGRPKPRGEAKRQAIREAS